MTYNFSNFISLVMYIMIKTRLAMNKKGIGQTIKEESFLGNL